ncbi:hypothetical protein SAMN05216593_105233 [Pseudomonas asturiensis]|uniref:FlxA-like protein n=1 Tax=Pseudomonas asturiensis TaxID=1190415 RepID=A0A1M7N6W7_9PSED|nr:hypothetical protein [Pseudomonas asturiensis]SHM99181.1 hypothetical protein SAMN05216593_105233 [Pseudomonas asturiensis]
MITLNLQFASAAPTSTLNTGVKSAADDATDAASDSTTNSPVEGVKVSLSSVSLQKAAEDSSTHSNKDIEESGLPEQAQKILKMIRELQQKIQEKLQELQALMADTRMSPDEKRARVAGVQSELGALTNSLMSANNTLAKLSRNGTLSSEQAQQASALAMKR